MKKVLSALLIMFPLAMLTSDDEQASPDTLEGLKSHARTLLLSSKTDKAKADQAIAIYQKILNRFPEDTPEGKAVVWANIGHAYIILGKFQEAAQVLAKAVALNPQRAQLYDSLGTALRKLHQYEDAITNYRKALELDPEMLYALSNLGACQYKLGYIDEAQATFKQVLEQDPTHFEVHWHIAKMYRRLALEHARKAKELCRDDASSIIEPKKIEMFLHQFNAP